MHGTVREEKLQGVHSYTTWGVGAKAGISVKAPKANGRETTWRGNEADNIEGPNDLKTGPQHSSLCYSYSRRNSPGRLVHADGSCTLFLHNIFKYF